MFKRLPKYLIAITIGLVLSAHSCLAQSDDASSGRYTIRPDRPHQVIRGLGFEIQSDSIGSGNAGMPDAVVAVPHDLTPDEKIRFYTEMLHGFRYARLALGLYLRGLDPEQKHIIERYPGQMDDLRAMQDRAGIEGFDVEYWSPAPYWKNNKSYYGGTIASTDPAFLNAFGDAVVVDLRYLQAHGLRIAQWGLQNEPGVGLPPKPGQARNPLDAAQSYATCHYTPEDYLAAMRAVVPKVRALLPAVEIQAPSWDGPAGEYAAQLRTDPALMANLNAWTWHQIGHNSDDQIDERAKYLQGAGQKPVYENEFEYQPWGTLKVDDYFMNTGQSLMNWMVFEDSPVWYWLHALKPVTNLEATGYALGFWRPAGPLPPNVHTDLQPGHWEFNPHNWNAIAGFLRYLPWDSTRLEVEESVVRHGQRILVWRSKDGKLGIALSNRGPQPYTFVLSGTGRAKLSGHRYTVQMLNDAIGSKTPGSTISITVPPQAFEFWTAS